MTLLSILTGLGVEYFLTSLDPIRNFSWYEEYSNWLERQCNRYSFWDGAAGVLLTVAVPLAVLFLVIWWLNSIWFVLSFILSIFIFIYCVGSDLNSLLNGYIEALQADDEGSISGIEHQLNRGNNSSGTDETVIIRSVLLRAHEHLFGVIFWFIVLGMVGALLFCLIARMNDKYRDMHGAYAEAVRDFHRVLIWPSARILALGLALGGSLVDALEGWRRVKGHTLDCSEDVVVMSGYGALQYQRQEIADENARKDSHLAHTQELQALLNRTLIIWLTVLGIMTLSGYVS